MEKKSQEFHNKQKNRILQDQEGISSVQLIDQSIVEKRKLEEDDLQKISQRDQKFKIQGEKLKEEGSNKNRFYKEGFQDQEGVQGKGGVHFVKKNIKDGTLNSLSSSSIVSLKRLTQGIKENKVQISQEDQFQKFQLGEDQIQEEQQQKMVAQSQREYVPLNKKYKSGLFQQYNSPLILEKSEGLQLQDEQRLGSGRQRQSCNILGGSGKKVDFLEEEKNEVQVQSYSKEKLQQQSPQRKGLKSGSQISKYSKLVRNVRKLMVMMRLIKILKNLNIQKKNFTNLHEDLLYRKYKWIPFLPDETVTAVWNLILIVNLFLTLVFVPIRVFFVKENTQAWVFLDYCLDFFFSIDIVMNFLTAFYNEQKKIVVDLKIIANRYARGYFLLDIFALIPFDDFTDFGFNKLFRLLRLPRIYKINRALQVTTTTSDLAIINYIIKIQQSFVAKKLIELLFLTFIISHIGACIWFAIAEYSNEPNDDKWVYRMQLENSEVFDQYISSLYWAMQTLSSVGYGDVGSVTDSERIFSIFYCAVSMAFQSKLIDQLGSLVQNDDMLMQIQGKLEDIVTFNKVPLSIASEVEKNLELNSQENMFWSLEKMQFFRILSVDLQTQLQIFANQDLISKVDFFQVDISFASALMTKITLQRVGGGAFQPDHLVYRAKDFFSNIYFILEGEVQEMDEKGVILFTYKAGEMFGHVDINSRFDRRFFAVSPGQIHCNFVQVSIEDFRYYLGKFPRVLRHFNQTVKKQEQIYQEILDEVYREENDIENLKKRALLNLQKIQQQKKFTNINGKVLDQINRDSFPRYPNMNLIVDSYQYYEKFINDQQFSRKMVVKKFDTIESLDIKNNNSFNFQNYTNNAGGSSQFKIPSLQNNFSYNNSGLTTPQEKSTQNFVKKSKFGNFPEDNSIKEDPNLPLQQHKMNTIREASEFSEQPSQTNRFGQNIKFKKENVSDSVKNQNEGVKSAREGVQNVKKENKRFHSRQNSEKNFDYSQNFEKLVQVKENNESHLQEKVFEQIQHDFSPKNQNQLNFDNDDDMADQMQYKPIEEMSETTPKNQEQMFYLNHKNNRQNSESEKEKELNFSNVSSNKSYQMMVNRFNEMDFNDTNQIKQFMFQTKYSKILKFLDSIHHERKCYISIRDQMMKKMKVISQDINILNPQNFKTFMMNSKQ